MSPWIWNMREASTQNRQQFFRQWAFSILSTKVCGAALRLSCCDYAWLSWIISDQQRITTGET